MKDEGQGTGAGNITQQLLARTDHPPEEGTIVDAALTTVADKAEQEMTTTSSKRGVAGFCHKLCQKNPLTFTLATSVCFLTQINMVIFMVSQITFLEKEFGFTSSQTGRLLSASQIGSLCLVLPAGHLASRIHVPRALALAAFIFGLASVMAGLPRFLFPVATAPSSSLSPSSSSPLSFEAGLTLGNGSFAAGDDGGGGGSGGSASVVSAADIPPAFCWLEGGGGGEDRCEVVGALSNGTSDPVQPSTEVVYNQRAYRVYLFLVVCQVIRGAMSGTAFPMFAEYIETNAKKTDTGFYTGIVYSVSMLGPAIAFLGGGAISKLHVSLQPTDMTPTHPDWVGAWWLGFLLFGSLAALAPVFIYRFPRHLAPPPPSPTPSPPPPSPSPLQPSSVLPSSSSSSLSALSLSSLREGKDVQREGARVGSVPERHKVEGASCLEMVRRGAWEVRGFLVSMVQLLTNPVYVLLVLSSCFFGFSMNSTYLFLPKYMQDQFQIPAWKANFIMGGAELSVGTSGFMFGGWLTKRLKMTRATLYKLIMAVTVGQVIAVVSMMFVGCPQSTLIGAPGQLAHSDNCSHSCACPDEVFPVCDRVSHQTYFSPCHAGCSALRDGVYMNCSCTASGQVYPGECIPDCSSVYYFSAIFFVMLFLVSVSGPLQYLVTVRSVSTPQRGLAIGLGSFLTGIGSFLVGPIFFGGLIDTFCDHWKSPCGVRGQCSVYNKQRFRVEMQVYSVVAILLAILTCFLSFLCFLRCPRFSPPPESACDDPKGQGQDQGRGEADGGDRLEESPPRRQTDPRGSETTEWVRLKDTEDEVGGDRSPSAAEDHQNDVDVDDEGVGEGDGDAVVTGIALFSAGKDREGDSVELPLLPLQNSHRINAVLEPNSSGR